MTLDLPFIFMALMGLAMLAYVILDGFDLGVGILLPLAPRHAVGIAVATYRDSVHVGLQANGAAVPDVGSLRDAVLKSAARLLDAS